MEYCGRFEGYGRGRSMQVYGYRYLGRLWSAMEAYEGLCRAMETLMKAYGGLTEVYGGLPMEMYKHLRKAMEVYSDLWRSI